MMYSFLCYFILFLIYSFIGWIIDIIGGYFDTKKIINRGFLIGPWCPIYGIASLCMITIINQYKSNLLLFFTLTVLIASLIEYFVSYSMEKLFRARWWDYSRNSFNINGRICLLNSIFFGILGTLLIYIINPALETIIKLNPKVPFYTLSILLLILFLLDVIISSTIMNKLKTDFKLKKADNTIEITKAMKEKILKRSFL